MKKNNDDLIMFPIWEGLDYAEELEPFIDAITCGHKTEEQDLLCLTQLLLLPQKEIDGSEIPQNSDFIRTFTDQHGESYLISNNSFQKIFKKSQFINTMSLKNEVIQTPTDAAQIWFISPAIKMHKANSDE